METSREKLGERVKAIRGDRPQKEFAEMLGFSRGYLADIERGRSYPSIPFLLSLDVNCDIDLHWLLTGKEHRGRTVSPEAVVMEPSTEEEAAFLSFLSALWEFYLDSDEEMRVWMRVQLRRAFPELAAAFADTKKQHSAATESA